jgi:quercetin dioxygenase-like cupin family protein
MINSNTRETIHRRWDELPFQDSLGGGKLAVLAGPGVHEDHDAEAVVMLAVEFAPNFYTAAHQHVTGHIEVVLEGSIQVGDRLEVAGDIRITPANVSYGPLTSGPEGCKLLEIFPNRDSILPLADFPDELITEFGDQDHLRSHLKSLLGI